MKAASLFRLEPLLPYLTKQIPVITANSRIHNKIIDAYNWHQQADGLLHWNPPQISSMEQWLESEYLSLCSSGLIEQPRLVADSAVIQRIWETVISETEHNAQLINPLSLINDLSRAYQTLQRWCLKLHDIKSDSPSWSQFCQWVEYFEEKLKTADLITPEDRQLLINDPYSAGQCQKLPELVIVGFDDVNPITSATFNAICEKLTVVHPESPVLENTKRLALPDFEEEISTAARWCKKQLLSDPTMRIGIVVPNLGQCRDQVMGVFNRVFEPQILSPYTDRYTPPFNISAGIPLASTPLISDTIDLIKLLRQQWKKEDIKSLFLSPFWHDAHGDEGPQRVVESLNQVGSQTISRRALRMQLMEIAEDSDHDSPTFLFCRWLEGLLQSLDTPGHRDFSRTSHEQWCNRFIDWLKSTGWPGSRRLDSNEFQQVNQWFQTLDQLARLDTAVGPVQMEEAIQWLERVAGGQHFQAKTPDAPIQILGILESSSLTFDRCWVVGMTQQEWPPAPAPSPFIPYDIQRQFRMPHADAERELDYATNLTRGLAKAADEVIFSWSRSSDESPSAPAPLIHHFKEIELDDLGILPSDPLDDYQRELFNGRELQWLDCSQAPPVSEQEQALLRNGTKILADQAACPAQAFFRHRVGLDQPVQAFLGLSPQQKGNLLHDVLYQFWGEVTDSDALIRLDEPTIKSILEETISVKTQKLSRSLPTHLRGYYLTSEIQRQVKLIHRWLVIEKSRASFRVSERESQHSISIGELSLNLRIDRVDELADGSKVIIDYKTSSNVNLRGLTGERPHEPQLPLYALAKGEDCNAVMFAQINPKQVKFSGFRSEDLALPEAISIQEKAASELPDTWTETLEYWRSQLTLLAAEFFSGVTSLDYKTELLRSYSEDLMPAMRHFDRRTN